MPAVTARQAAVSALVKVNTQGAYSNLVLNETLKKSGLSPADSSFAGRLFYGTLERRLTLDHVINHYSKKPVSKLTPAVAEILRTAVYQLLYLDSVPDSAAVNEAVGLTKKMKAASASGFVNAVLRNFLRDEKKIPQIKGNRLKKLEVRYSCPQWLIKTLLEQYDEPSTLAMLEHSLDRPPLYVRVNTTKISVEDCIAHLEAEGVQVQKDPDLQGCLLLSGTASIEKLTAFSEGLFHVQDKSSQLCAAALDAKEGQRVLDTCSAPGSKSFTTAEKMGDSGEVISCDIFEEKIKKISEGAKRLGLNSISAKLQDGTVFCPDLGEFDRVLCDAPCSGIGIIGRKPEIKYKKQQELADLPQIQKKILDTVSRYVKKEGILVYSTCTLLREENDQVIEAFLSQHTEFEPCPLPQEVREAAKLTDPAAWKVTLFPQMADTDGFFISCVKKVR